MRGYILSGKNGPSAETAERGNVYASINRPYDRCTSISRTQLCGMRRKKRRIFTKTDLTEPTCIWSFPWDELIENEPGKVILCLRMDQHPPVPGGPRRIRERSLQVGNVPHTHACGKGVRGAKAVLQGNHASYRGHRIDRTAERGKIESPQRNDKGTGKNCTLSVYHPRTEPRDARPICDSGYSRLIEGASTGKGLGIKFLKHIEKVKLILHCVSLEPTPEQMKRDYETVRNELVSFNPELSGKEEVILFTKADLLHPEEREKKVKSFAAEGEHYTVSVYDADALDNLQKRLLQGK
jgi:hypothetical protein